MHILSCGVCILLHKASDFCINITRPLLSNWEIATRPRQWLRLYKPHVLTPGFRWSCSIEKQGEMKAGLNPLVHNVHSEFFRLSAYCCLLFKQITVYLCTVYKVLAFNINIV